MTEKKRTARIPQRKRAPVEEPEKRIAPKPKVVKKLEKVVPLVETKKSIYEPIREQLMIVLEYLNILEKRRSSDTVTEIGHLLDFMDVMRRKCEVYLNFQLMKAGN